MLCKKMQIGEKRWLTLICNAGYKSIQQSSTQPLYEEEDETMATYYYLEINGGAVAFKTATALRGFLSHNAVSGQLVKYIVKGGKVLRCPLGWSDLSGEIMAERLYK